MIGVPAQLFAHGLAVFGAWFGMRFGRPKGSTRSNATYATLRRRIKYGGRKGRRAIVRVYGSQRAMQEAPTVAEILQQEQEANR
jgi:hypothetical protein